MRSAWRPAHLATVLKLVICPLIGWGLAVLWGLNHEARFVCLVYLACPTAVASFVMAQAMKGDAVLAAGTVAISTVYSCVALSVVLLLVGG
jgi:predicted permease